ncbi:hypothetical protein Bca52824_074956 [Brassica carinata]|uniref:Uncharacterized protein n=1 Tax=Brassica carinata TaxID=52824 RepID=A0A8X7TV83_BRACI|nr:hypothetical protein Bca52824_074956 [Brassica carinata]
MDFQSPDVEPITAKILPFWPLDFWDQDIVDYWLMVSLLHSGYEGKDAFKDPSYLERSIRKEKRAASIDTTSTTSIDTCDRATIDGSTRTLIDTNPRADMAATLLLHRDENEDLHDPEGHLCIAADQNIDGQGAAILEPSAATEDAKVLRQRTLGY